MAYTFGTFSSSVVKRTYQNGCTQFLALQIVHISTTNQYVVCSDQEFLNHIEIGTVCLSCS